MGRIRTRTRRATHDRMDAPARSVCPQCGEAKLPHRVCPNCGAKIIEEKGKGND